MLNHKRRRIALLGIIWIIVTTVGCTGVGAIIPPLGTALAITQTPTPTPRECPTNATPISDNGGISPKLIVALIDTQADDTKLSAQAFEIVNDLMPKVIEPGDRLVMMRMGVRKYQEAVIKDEHTLSVTRPAIPPSPTPHATLTPVPTPIATVKFSLQEAGIEDAGTATQAAANATATQYAFEDICAGLEWRNRHGQIATEWSATQAVVINNFTNTIQGDINSYQKQGDLTATPIPHMVYESLSNATITFQNECGRYGRCILIIFSDLKDWRPETPSNQHINLTRVEVISVMLNCQTIFQPDCASVQDLWTKNFQSYGVRSLDYRNSDGLEDYLVEFLRR